MSGTRFVDIRRFDVLDSTNRYLLEEARAGAPAGVVAVADYQTAGRGRLGRAWEAPAGANLLLSVLVRPDLPPDRRHLASAAMALAAADAAQSMAGVALGVKWPNDLLADDGLKVAGVLAETDLGSRLEDPGIRPSVVVGIGVNVNWPRSEGDLPDRLRGTATSLARLAGRPVDREGLLGVLLDVLGTRLAELDVPSRRGRLVDELRRRCTTVGRSVRIQLDGSTIEGTATGLTEEGHLVVDLGGTSTTVVAGDVVHLRPGR